jgi:diketogulonate reductase-like aldo/keto reductase
MSTPTVTLNDGNTIPAIGFGAGTALFGGECTKYTLSALNKGYRYLDMAQMYGNSQWVGEAIKQWGGKRDDLFLLTKCELRELGSTHGQDHPGEEVEISSTADVEESLRA